MKLTEKQRDLFRLPCQFVIGRPVRPNPAQQALRSALDGRTAVMYVLNEYAASVYSDEIKELLRYPSVPIAVTKTEYCIEIKPRVAGAGLIRIAWARDRVYLRGASLLWVTEV